MNASSEKAAAALPPMALLATLQTATHVHGAVEARRAGRDPTAQEPAAAARAYLRSAAGELTPLHMQLLMAKVQAERKQAALSDEPPGDVGEAERLSAVVRRFDVMMKLRRAERLLHGIHQRLMSLYPAVSEALVEEARRCQREEERLHEARPGAFDERLGLFLQRLLGLAVWVKREL